RISTAAAAPTLGPSGSWLRVTSAISTAIASDSDASTPIACRASQFRAIWANTATSTRATIRPRPSRLRRIARPLHSTAGRRRGGEHVLAAEDHRHENGERDDGETELDQPAPPPSPELRHDGTVPAWGRLVWRLHLACSDIGGRGQMAPLPANVRRTPDGQRT